MPEKNTYDKDYSGGKQFEIDTEVSQPTFNTDVEKAAEEKRASMLKNRRGPQPPQPSFQTGPEQMEGITVDEPARQVPNQAVRTSAGGGEQPQFASRPSDENGVARAQGSWSHSMAHADSFDTSGGARQASAPSRGGGAETARNLSAARDAGEEARRRLLERSAKMKAGDEKYTPDFGADAGDPAMASLPSLTKHAILIARRWQQVPDNVSDQDAMAQGLIPAELIQMVMQIIQQLMQGCLSNSRAAAWGRVRGYMGLKEMDRLGDNLRLNGVINNWMDRLGIPRDIGDVVSVRRALVEAADSVKQEEFNQLQTEILFLTI